MFQSLKTFLVELHNYIGTSEYNAMIVHASSDICMVRKQIKVLDLLMFLGHAKGSYRSIITK